MEAGGPGDATADAPAAQPKTGGGERTREDVMAERKKIQAGLLARFGKRRQGRKHKADRSANRSTDEFLSAFHSQDKDILARLESSDQLSKEEIDPFFKGIQNELIDIQERLAKACGYLPSYHFEQLGIKLDKLKALMRERREEVAPKPAFVFAPSAKAPKKSKPVEAEEGPGESEADALLKLLSQDQENTITLENLKLQDRKLAVGEVNGSDVHLKNLKNCTIIITDTIGALHMNNIEHCTIITGPVAGSLFVEHIDHSTVHCATRQARIHYATETAFYLHVNSKPIVENCDTLQFAPYTISYDGFQEQLKVASIDPDKNQWQDVQDFKWLRRQQSPHWAVMPEENRETDIRLELDDDEL